MPGSSITPSAASKEQRVRSEALKAARVLIVGDVMLDRYWFGDVNRISPEAPVPVVKVDRTEERLGGAANVARNVTALGAKAGLISVIGRDEAGLIIESLLKEDNIQAALHHDSDIATTVKLRVIGRQQQLLRIDFETQPGHEVLASALEDFRRMLDEYDVVVMSDYGKGGLAHIEKMIEMANQAGKPVLVDPKGDDYTRYKNATLLTPNRSEFREVAGSWKNEEDLTRRAQELRQSLHLKGLLVTRSEEGMTLYRQDGALHQPAHALEVFDVSGAGDTVIATLGVMLAAGADMPEAMQMANRAAGIVVGKLGTAVAHYEELFDQASNSQFRNS